VPPAELLEIDRWALSRAAELQAEVLAHYEVYEFHPVVAKLQVFCSEDLGAFYLDVLKDRLYTTAPKSLARRSAQTALWQITHAMLRWMAPFLSFTAEEAWTASCRPPTRRRSSPRPTGTSTRPTRRCCRSGRALRTIRELANKEIETVRGTGAVGSSLQASLPRGAPPEDIALLRSLGDDLKFVFITSSVAVADAPAPCRCR
jgi:isoleucyl-tRNA synthetase